MFGQCLAKLGRARPTSANFGRIQRKFCRHRPKLGRPVTKCVRVDVQGSIASGPSWVDLGPMSVEFDRIWSGHFRPKWLSQRVEARTDVDYDGGLCADLAGQVISQRKESASLKAAPSSESDLASLFSTEDSDTLRGMTSDSFDDELGSETAKDEAMPWRRMRSLAACMASSGS